MDRLSGEFRFDHQLASCDGNAENRVLKRVGGKFLKMKKVILLGLVGLIFSGCVIGQQKLIAKRTGDSYEMVFTKKAFASIWDAEIAPYLDPSSREKYSFVDVKID